MFCGGALAGAAYRWVGLKTVGAAISILTHWLAPHAEQQRFGSGGARSGPVMPGSNLCGFFFMARHASINNKIGGFGFQNLYGVGKGNSRICPYQDVCMVGHEVSNDEL